MRTKQKKEWYPMAKSMVSIRMEGINGFTDDCFADGRELNIPPLEAKALEMLKIWNEPTNL